MGVGVGVRVSVGVGVDVGAGIPSHRRQSTAQIHPGLLLLTGSKEHRVSWVQITAQ